MLLSRISLSRYSVTRPPWPIQYCCQCFSIGLYALRLFPVIPFSAVQFSRRPQPPAIDCTLLFPCGVPSGVVTPHSPIQKSNARRSAISVHGEMAGGIGARGFVDA